MCGGRLMWIVDSSVWIDYFNGRATPEVELLDAALGKRELGVLDIILAEVLQGFRNPRHFDVARSALLSFPVYSVGGIELALASAANFRVLRQRGNTVRSTIDCLIATFVIRYDLTLLHSDRDFEVFEQELGLSVVRPQ